MILDVQPLLAVLLNSQQQPVLKYDVGLQIGLRWRLALATVHFAMCTDACLPGRHETDDLGAAADVLAFTAKKTSGAHPAHMTTISSSNLITIVIIITLHVREVHVEIFVTLL